LTSNLQDLVNVQKRKSVPPHAMLVGFPDYRMGTSKSVNDINASSENASVFTDLLADGIAELPGTEKEIQQVRAVLEANNWNGDTHLGPDALEGKVKDGEKITLLHIATHGFF